MQMLLNQAEKKEEGTKTKTDLDSLSMTSFSKFWPIFETYKAVPIVILLFCQRACKLCFIVQKGLSVTINNVTKVAILGNKNLERTATHFLYKMNVISNLLQISGGPLEFPRPDYLLVQGER